jgi:tRNA uridine 5-carbamoylmethylation protein Kti12
MNTSTNFDKTADAADPDVIDDMSSILANLDLANEVARTNFEQQNNISNDQALFQLKYATIAKCVEVIMSIDPDGKDASHKIKTYKELMDQFVDIFDKMKPKKPAMVMKKNPVA